MPTSGPARTVAAACLVLVTLAGVAPRPVAALEPPRPLPDHRPVFVTETDTRPWIDCLWASAAMLLDKWTNGDVRLTHGELRRLGGDTRGGSSLEDLQAAFRRLGFDVPLDANGDSMLTWGALLAHLEKGAGAVVLGDESQMPRWFGRWDHSFWRKKGKKDNHAVYVERYDPRHGRVWLMDPLARGAWHGEWISVGALRRFAWFKHGYVAAVSTPTARAAPFAGVAAVDAQVGISHAALTASWRLRTPRRWAYPGADVHVSMVRAADPVAAAIAAAQVDPRATVDPAPARPVAGVSQGTLRIATALPSEPGAYVASLALTDRRFGARIVASHPVGVFIPGARRATLRLNVHEHVLVAGEGLRVNLSVANSGEATWAERARRGPEDPETRERATRVTATWVRLDAPAGAAAAGTAPDPVELRLVPLEPGGMVRLSESLAVPEGVGRWALVIDVVDDLAGSFAALGSRPAVALFEVVAPRGIEAIE